MKAWFMTGIYGGFEPKRVERETRPGFWGVEACSLADWGEASRTAEWLRERNLRMGVHFPLVAGAYPEVILHPLLTSADQAEREAGFHALEQDLVRASELGAEYVITHVPKPAVIDPELDWSDWRFVHRGETIPASATTPAEQEDLLDSAFERLVGVSQKSGVKVVLENDTLHSMHYGSLLPRLFAAHPELGFCFDTGRARILERTDPKFDALAFARTMVPYTTNLHVWTSQAGKNRLGGHHPVLPDLRPEDGWGETENLLKVLSQVSLAHVLFEHRSDLVSERQLDECYRWVAQSLTS